MTEPAGGEQPMEGVEDTVPAGPASALTPAASVVPPAAPVVTAVAPVFPPAAPEFPPAAPVAPVVLPPAAPALPAEPPLAARAVSAPTGGPGPQAVPETAAKPPVPAVAKPAPTAVAKPAPPAEAKPAPPAVAKPAPPAVPETVTKPPAVSQVAAKPPALATPRSVIQATPQQPALPMVKVPNLSIQAVTLAAPEGGEETKKVVPGLKIIGLSSEMRKAMAGEAPSDDEEDEDEDEDAEDEEDSDEDGEGEEDGEEGEEDEEGSDDDDEEGDEVEEVVPEPETLKLLQKTPKVTIRKVMKVDTPGGAVSMNKRALMLEEEEDTPGKKRGRPSRAAIELRERERAEAIARGEPDPELKRKRRKPTKLADGASSEEETKEEKKKRKKEEREEKKRLKKQLKSEGSEDTEEDKPKKKKGRQKKELSEEQLKEREETRKEKYRLVREKAKAKAAKRQMYLIRKRDERKAQKLEERKRQEAHQKRMAELKMQYLDDNAQDGEMAVEGEEGELLQQDENSQSSLGSFSAAKKRKNWGDVGMVEMAGIHNPLANVSAETLFEYKWPLEGKHAEHFFLQEQVTEFLGVKSFKRKYPECPRRTINMEERDFLIEMKIVNMTQADLGLTAIPSSSVLDIMCQDFYEHYEDYYAVVKERKERSLRNTNFSSSGGTIQSSEAVKLAAEYNKRLNADRKTIRTAYFDMQTFAVHYPRTNKGRMRVVKRAAPGTYPVAMIPGQFVDSYKTYGPNQLKHFPLNSVTSAPPPAGITTKDMKLGSEGSETDGSSSSSGSSSGSESDSESDSEAEVPARRMTRGRETKKEEKETKKKEKVKEEEVKVEEVPLKKVDEVRPGTFCKNCQGNMNQNKLGQPEMLLHCTKCNSSCHPTCVGLHLDLVNYVTAYNWECTDCKQCMTCQDPADEDKMLFCDLCDRGYHIYCVGLQGIPTGRWHCSKCSYCESCGTKSAAGDGSETVKGEEKPVWAFETKTSMKGDKIYSHTMCAPCHKQWKKGTFCPDCNGVFGKSQGRDARGSSNCWVCQRQHHTVCVGLDKAGDRFICGACQRRTQEKTIAGGRQPETPGRPGMMGSASQNTPVNQFSRTPATTASYSRSGRRVTQINFANQF